MCVGLWVCACGSCVFRGIPLEQLQSSAKAGSSLTILSAISPALRLYLLKCLIYLRNYSALK